MKERTLGLIGAGRMGEALIKGLLSSKKMSSIMSILACDKDKERLAYIASTYGVEVYSKASEVAGKADISILAVKPQDLEEALEEIKEELTEDKLLVSIVAGAGIDHISYHLVHPCPVVRVMPNTPALVMEGISAICPGKGTLPERVKEVVEIFNALGKTVLIEDETLMDAVTGLSGSGPAFVFLFLEALTDGGVKMGLKRDTARLLALQTVLGASKLAMETGRHFADLKDMVTSPGGTTIAGLSHMEKEGLRGIVIEAVEKATLRSREISRKG